MATYTVYVPAIDAGRPAASGSAVYIRDGFAPWAGVFGPLWCIYRRCWLGFFIWCAAAAIIAGIGWMISAEPLAIWAALVTLQIWFAFEANQFRRRSLARRNHVFADLILADSVKEAEIVFAHRLANEHAGHAPEMAPAAAYAVPRARMAPDSAAGLAPFGAMSQPGGGR